MPYSQHTKQWKCLTHRAKKWLQTSKGQSPSFIVMYLKSEKRRPDQIVWEGPKHMRGFATSDCVRRKFLEVALSRPLINAGPGKTQCPMREPEPIKLPSADPKTYRSDHLQKIIPRITNPSGKKNFWTNSKNQPAWWPRKHVPFESPNHAVGKLTAIQLRKILSSFLKDCKGLYTIVGEQKAPPSAHTDSESESEPEDSVAKGDINTHPQQVQETVQGPNGALLKLEGVDHRSWSLFQSTVRELANLVDTSILTNLDILCSRDIPNRYSFDQRWLREIKAIIPAGYHVHNSTANGDCLFNSASIALAGSEEHSELMRFASVLNGVEHFDQYLEMFKRFVKEPDQAVQFLSTVSTESSLNNRPKNSPTTDEILNYTLQEEIMNTSKRGSYSGFLQVQFLASALERPINQCTEVKRGYEHFQSTVFPYSGTKGAINEALHIIWLHMRTEGQVSNTMNHIAPLVPGSVRVTRKEVDSSTVPDLSTSLPRPLSDVCIKSKLGECSLDLFKESQNEGGDWVRCDKCWGWYHCACIGIAADFFTEHTQFVCCEQYDILLESNFNPVVLVHPPRGRGRGRPAKSMCLKFLDVYSLYPGQGITDGVIDFYKATMLPDQEHITFLSALTYSQLATQSLDKTSRYKAIHKALNGSAKFWEKKMVGFPCKLSGLWHWILVVVDLGTGEALIFDSMGSQSHSFLDAIGDFIRAIVPSANQPIPMLTPKHITVPQQSNGVDCGIHVIDNMSRLAKKMEVSSSCEAVDTGYIRASIIRDCYLKSQDHFKQQLSKSDGNLRQKTKQQKTADQIAYIQNHVEDGLKVVTVKGKGKGIIATKPFKRGDFICEYNGVLLTLSEARDKEISYSKQSSIGCYMYYFEFRNKKYCVDATQDDKRMGRLINHCRTKPNIVAKVIEIGETPHLCFLAAKDIDVAEELLYDYGERRGDIIKLYPWLAE